MYPDNAPAEERRRWHLMELNQVHRATTVGLAEYVKNSTDDQIQFVHKHEHKSEKVSHSPCKKKIPKTGTNRICHAPK